MKIIIDCAHGSISGDMISSTVVWAELNVTGSRWAASTSSKRLSA